MINNRAINTYFKYIVRRYTHGVLYKVSTVYSYLHSKAKTIVSINILQAIKKPLIERFFLSSYKTITA
jgi:hypothetical protein